MTEAEFIQQVIELAHWMHWRVAHFRPARTERGWRTPMSGDTGFPDLVLARRGRVIFAELKVGRNKMSSAQIEWAEQIGGEFYLWYPEQLPEIQEVLK